MRKTLAVRTPNAIRLTDYFLVGKRIPAWPLTRPG